MSDSEKRINQLIANNLVSLLEKNNRTQLELAEYLGVTQATISNWCNGIKMPRMDKIDLICGFFNIRRSALLGSDSPSASDVDTDKLFIEKYGQDVFDHAMQYNRLDDRDQGKADGFVSSLLTDDKYKEVRSSDEKAI